MPFDTPETDGVFESGAGGQAEEFDIDVVDALRGAAGAGGPPHEDADASGDDVHELGRLRRDG
ncbi:hypothetical protein D0T12_16485 [Actinomadura spongiicola]|uniref:Uncharacterized protein n=1 Tax=Actinomadura spongiicola TaxID=2303421 RepID=A0A372GEL7_9ACTN|nr:hypothetical protein D0T12_16485 [Actinomadura spongiicola]